MISARNDQQITSIREHYDCVVMGAGPAGSSTATLVADAGHSTLLVEREKVPRFHVGESLMPETYWSFKRLGILDKMNESSFVRKVGVQFVTGAGKESQPFYFQDHDPRECSTTWHVERGEFDKLLFDNAAEKGATCVDETRVTRVEIDENAAEGQLPVHRVQLRLADGETRWVSANVVVDATGQSALLANRMGIREVNQRLKKAAIWTYYEGAKRGERTTTIILHTSDKQAWFWYIPLSNNIVSVGVVSDNDYLLKGRSSPQETFETELAKCSGVKDRVDVGKRTADFHVAQEFSYTTKQHAGNGWVLVGDAFGFIDPIYSSGVFLALLSGERAADAIIGGFAKHDLSGQQLGHWADEFKRGSELIRKLVHAYYTDDFSFGAFMKQHPEHQGRLTDLLIGRVFHDDVAQIFDDMEEYVPNLTSD